MKMVLPSRAIDCESVQNRNWYICASMRDSFARWQKIHQCSDGRFIWHSRASCLKSVLLCFSRRYQSQQDVDFWNAGHAFNFLIYKQSPIQVGETMYFIWAIQTRQCDNNAVNETIVQDTDNRKAIRFSLKRRTRTHFILKSERYIRSL